MNKFQLLLLLFLASFQIAQAQVISKSFEMRYFTDSLRAMGTIDFKGDSSIFSAEERVGALQKFIQYGKNYFDDKNLDVRAVPSKEFQAALQSVKQPPQPQYRERKVLNKWKYRTNKQGLREQQEEQIREWTKNKKASITNGQMYAMKNFEYNKKFDLQEGRFTLEWQAKIPKTKERSAFLLLDQKSNPVVLMGINSDGECFYKSKIGLPIDVGQFRNDTLINFKLFVDAEAGRFSLWLNGEEKADFVRSLSNNPINKLFLKLPLGATLDNIYGLSYEKVTRPDNPQHPIPLPKGYVFLDERFEFTEEIGDLGLTSFDDSNWKETDLPIATSDRFRDSDLILSHTITVQEKRKAILQIKHLSAGAELWLNNRIIHVQNERGDLKLDLTERLKTSFNNKLILRLRAGSEGHLAEAWIDYPKDAFIQNTQVSTEFTDNETRLRINADLISERMQASGEWNGRVTIELFPWLPNESSVAASSRTFPVKLRAFKEADFSELLIIQNPQFWSPESPNLYRVAISLVDNRGRIIDDFSLVTGIRRVSQDYGTFHLNNKAMFLHGANWTDYIPFPIGNYERPEDVSEAWLVRTIESMKALDGNVLRVSDKHKVNKDLLLRLCDQFGMMLVYQTENETQPWKTDFEELQNKIKQLKHHPSIVMWQGADEVQFSSYTQDARIWLDEYHKSIRAVDTTRLIVLTGTRPSFGTSGTPNDNGSRLYDSNYKRYRMLYGAGTWLANDVVRVGNDPALSYGADWNSLRTFPVSPLWDTLRLNYLNSPKHIYVDFHSEGVAGQENPLTVKGTPYRYSEAYQSPYIAPMLNTELAFEDWIVTQAWQAFAAYESHRKKRWLGYDGLLWSSLMNGADPAALLDAEGYLKLAARMCKMAAQPTLAGSYNTDVAYSTGEQIPVFVTNIGDATMLVDVKVRVKDVVGDVLQSVTIPAQAIPKGNATIELGAWESTVSKRGWYMVEYEVRRR